MPTNPRPKEFHSRLGCPPAPPIPTAHKAPATSVPAPARDDLSEGTGRVCEEVMMLYVELL